MLVVMVIMLWLCDEAPSLRSFGGLNWPMLLRVLSASHRLAGQKGVAGVAFHYPHLDWSELQKLGSSFNSFYSKPFVNAAADLIPGVQFHNSYPDKPSVLKSNTKACRNLSLQYCYC
ncbi:hypothetical protein EV127DRAFT_225683 [Xylaria flabelliformis]|nr:hypothetical protein EV127DRAFT_225683 [Xylaria flabelliformis]